MKKALLGLVVFITAQTGFGQGLFDRLHYGIKAGGNYSNFTNADFATEGVVGFHAGVMVSFKLTDNLSIQEDFLFSTQGAKANNNNWFGKDDLTLSYLSVPIVLKYHTLSGFYVEGGGQANMLISDVKNTAFSEFAQKIDAGVVGGLGFQCREGVAKGLGIGARYYQGLTKVGTFNSSSASPDFKNAVAQLSLFYYF